jgi:hypothetical protein
VFFFWICLNIIAVGDYFYVCESSFLTESHESYGTSLERQVALKVKDFLEVAVVGSQHHFDALFRKN